MVSGCKFTKIIIVQSLEPHEVKTGQILAEFIRAQIDQLNLEIPVFVLNCESAINFLEILRNQTKESELTFDIPLLHVECHGDPLEGLEFENGSTLAWPEIAKSLVQLNALTRFNLLTVFSACFGGNFLGEIGAISPAPTWCMLAPTEKVDPAEILQGFRTFYSTLLSQKDVGKAITAMSRLRLSNGHWFGVPAELWFEKLVIEYIKKHCTKAAIRERAKSLYRTLRKEGKHQSIGSLTRILQEKNRDSFLNKYFEIYFMTDRIPENSRRFWFARERLEKKLSDLRRSNKYVL